MRQLSWRAVERDLEVTGVLGSGEEHLDQVAQRAKMQQGAAALKGRLCKNQDLHNIT